MTDYEKLNLQNQKIIRVKSTSNNEFLSFFMKKSQKNANFLGQY